jgi:hypothetical protein
MVCSIHSNHSINPLFLFFKHLKGENTMSRSFFPKRVVNQHNLTLGRSFYEAQRKAAKRLTPTHAWLIALAIILALLVAACGPDR